MQTLSLVIGILAILGMLVGFIPCFGWLNWLNIPFSVVGIIISLIAMATTGNEDKNNSIAGLVCCSIALILGFIRLILGAGIF